MPGPVSDTETMNQPSAATAFTTTSPTSENLMAFPTRFSSTWVMRRSSPLPGGKSGATRALRASCFSSAKERSEKIVVCTTSPIEYSASESVSCPASILERSSTSLIRPRRWSPLLRVRSSVSRISGGTTPKMLSRISSV